MSFSFESNKLSASLPSHLNREKESCHRHKKSKEMNQVDIIAWLSLYMSTLSNSLLIACHLFVQCVSNSTNMIEQTYKYKDKVILSIKCSPAIRLV